MYGIKTLRHVHMLELCIRVCAHSVPVRLAGNDRLPNAGRLEVYYDGSWGTVNNRTFDNRDAHAACYMLGYRYL